MVPRAGSSGAAARQHPVGIVVLVFLGQHRRGFSASQPEDHPLQQAGQRSPRAVLARNQEQQGQQEWGQLKEVHSEATSFSGSFLNICGCAGTVNPGLNERDGPPRTEPRKGTRQPGERYRKSEED